MFTRLEINGYNQGAGVECIHLENGDAVSGVITLFAWYYVTDKGEELRPDPNAPGAVLFPELFTPLRETLCLTIDGGSPRPAGSHSWSDYWQAASHMLGWDIDTRLYPDGAHTLTIAEAGTGMREPEQSKSRSVIFNNAM